MLMASTVYSPRTIAFFHKPSTLIRNPRFLLQSKPLFALPRLVQNRHLVSSNLPTLNAIRDSSETPIFRIEEEDENFLVLEQTPVKFICLVLLWASLSVAYFAFSGDAKAAVDSIKASSLGVKVASALRTSGWSDQAIVFSLATLPLLELRAAIPVGYWLQLNPLILTVLSVLGNMVPVPFIILYFKRFARFVTGKNESMTKLVNMLFERAKQKAGPVEEFQWLGLMLFVAVPFPGTGAWTGAFIASVLDMPFWPAVSANFLGVVLAGLLVNLLVNLGLKYAVVTGVILFIISTCMWSGLRSLRNYLNSLK